MSVIMHNTLAKVYVKLRYLYSKGNSYIWCSPVYVRSIESSYIFMCVSYVDKVYLS